MVRLSIRFALTVCMLAGANEIFLNGPTSALAAAPAIEEEWATEVSASSATFWAKINPNETPTTYRFEYATTEAALLDGEGKMLPISPAEGSVGSGAGGVIVQAHPQELTPHTSYWARFAAKNATEETSGCRQAGSCESITTQSAAGALALPDKRAWELVSPANKDGANIVPPEEFGGVVQAAQGEPAITYLSIGPLENPIGNSNVTQVLSARGAHGGWSSRDIATPHSVATGISESGQEYRYFSTDLSIGLVEPFGSGSTGVEPGGAVPLSAGASEMTIYLGADTLLQPELSEQSTYEQATVEGGYLPLVTGCPLPPGKCRTSRVSKDANVPLGTRFGGQLKFQGATPDLSHVIISSRVPLTTATPEGEPSTEGGLYEWTGGRLQLVDILPDGEQEHPGGAASLGEAEGRNARNAISNDGSRVVWSAEGHLFQRDVSLEQTVQLDLFQGGSGLSFNARFQFATADGTKVFFTDEAQLTANSSAVEGRPDLYECDIVEVGGKLTCKLSDLTVDPHYNVATNPRENADVKGMAMIGSDNSSFLYFVAEGELTEMPNAQGEKAKAGKGKRHEAVEDNLYMLHYSEEKMEWEPPVFIGGLSEGDSPDWGPELVGNLQMMTSRVAPNGKYLVFMSEASLTGYNNIDVNSGQRDEEVYLYNAETARLACVSCNPTGERPAGIFDSGGRLVDSSSIWAKLGGGRWLAGNVPGWTAMQLNFARYQSRYLSNDGRVIFDSPDALVPQANNGLENVYEYEPEGTPRSSPDMCTNLNTTFSASAHGCIGLISSGASNEESAFLDASGKGIGGEEAEDVFFVTSDQLVSRDKDTAFDVYDAHVCTSSAPCSTEAVSAPSCVAAESCKVAPSPQPSVFGAPASETISGAPGNMPVLTITNCPKHKKLSHGKCLKVKARHRKKAGAKKSGTGRRGKKR